METLRALRSGYLPAGDELVPPGWLDLTPILGIWRNLDESSAGVASLVLTSDGDRLLVLDALYSFHDSSGRADYFTRDFFHR
jgi:hypothetical protein